MATVFDINIEVLNYKEALEPILRWSRNLESRYVCVANVHMVMEAKDSKKFHQIVRSADLVVPDGMPLVWLMRLKGNREQSRIYGPDLMLEILQVANKENIPVGLFGTDKDSLKRLVDNIKTMFPYLNIVYSCSPPFRKLSESEDLEIVNSVNLSGTRILFVGLGCPKQEVWMAEHKQRINAVMVGVGAAFNFHAGVIHQAPPWMQRNGMEWLFRLFVEPRRLWKRYIYNNPRFLILGVVELISHYQKSIGLRKK